MILASHTLSPTWREVWFSKGILIESVHFKKTVARILFLCGTFDTNQNKKFHNFERNKISATQNEWTLVTLLDNFTNCNNFLLNTAGLNWCYSSAFFNGLKVWIYFSQKFGVYCNANASVLIQIIFGLIKHWIGSGLTTSLHS